MAITKSKVTDNGNIPITLKLNREIYNKIKLVALLQKKRSASGLINQVLGEYLAENFNKQFKEIRWEKF